MIYCKDFYIQTEKNSHNNNDNKNKDKSSQFSTKTTKQQNTIRAFFLLVAVSANHSLISHTIYTRCFDSNDRHNIRKYKRYKKKRKNVIQATSLS